MNDSDTVDVISELNGSLGEVSMHATADEIVAVGRTRRRRRRLVGVAAGVAGVSALTLTITYGHSPTAPAVSAGGHPATGVHIHEASFTLDSQSDGTLRVTWDKQRYFTDHASLETALHQAGFPVTMRVGEFCLGPGDDPTVDQSGVGPGVDQVMKGEDAGTGTVTFVFTPSAMPAGKQLFVGYLTEAQRAAAGSVGSVERLVSATAPLTCTTTLPALPPAQPRTAPSGADADGAGAAGNNGNDTAKGGAIPRQ